jgi:hypothetical protein
MEVATAPWPAFSEDSSPWSLNREWTCMRTPVVKTRERLQHSNIASRTAVVIAHPTTYLRSPFGQRSIDRYTVACLTRERGGCVGFVGSLLSVEIAPSIGCQLSAAVGGGSFFPLRSSGTGDQPTKPLPRVAIIRNHRRVQQLPRSRLYNGTTPPPWLSLNPMVLCRRLAAPCTAPHARTDLELLHHRVPSVPGTW